MPVIAPPTPEGLRRAFEAAGWEIIDEDEFNWLMGKDGHRPVPIPKKGRRVAIGLTDDIVHSSHVPQDLRKAIMDEVHHQALNDETGGNEDDVVDSDRTPPPRVG